MPPRIRPDPDPSTPPRPSFYRTHGRAFFKCFTLAFFTYQLVYYGWLMLETEYTRDEKEREIRGLEAEVRHWDCRLRLAHSRALADSELHLFSSVVPVTVGFKSSKDGSN
ncbi:hypothetical protein DV737_g1761, partial [Chaetothyriales sp. CBS 132003]